MFYARYPEGWLPAAAAGAAGAHSGAAAAGAAFSTAAGACSTKFNFQFGIIWDLKRIMWPWEHDY